MCGIAGIYSFSEDGNRAVRDIELALVPLRNRGPDASGIYREENIGLAHTRLSIIDLTSAANQPLHDVTGRYTIIANAEIYNYRELRTDLLKSGISFATKSDTEVILYLFIRDGVKCLEKLNGLFAFAIYDKVTKSLVLVRDRFGIKPLLFYHDSHKFIFASEMKGLMQMNIQKEVDWVSLHHYFQFNFIPPPHSIFKNVVKLKPGHYISVQKDSVTTERFYSIPYQENLPATLEYRSAQKKLRFLISESVRMRMVSDVALGAFLSGGVDSSIVVAEAVKHKEKLDTFAIGYETAPFFDETQYAALVAKKFQTTHHTFKLTSEDLHANLHRILDDISEPFADSSALVVHILSRLVRKHVTVALSGDGADELFGGYHKHRAHFRALHPGLLSTLVRWGMVLWQRAPKSRNNKLANLCRQLERYGKGLKLSARDRYWLWATLSSEEEVRSLLQTSVDQQQIAGRKDMILRKIGPLETMGDILRTDMHLVLEGDMLHKIDSMSMAHGLEVRTPYLDHNLVNFCFGLADTFKVTPKMQKRILQDAYRDQLPPEIYRRRKQGFEVPLLQWFKTELRSEIETNYLNPDMMEEQQIFNPHAVLQLKRQLFSNNPGDSPARVWALIVFQHWWKKHMT